MPDRQLNSTVIGLGVGEQHALALLNDPRTKLCAVVENDLERARDFIEKQKDKTIEILSFEDAVNKKGMDLIAIASFDEDHYEQVLYALKNGKHVFVEKPLCRTQQELETLYDTWKQSPKALISNLVLRKAPLYIHLTDLIRSGKMGEIYAFDGDYLYGRIHKITEGWRSETENYSIMQGGGIHIIDLMLNLTGQKPVTVQSVSNKIATRNTPFRYHDFHNSIFHFESGLIGRITANFGCVHRHQHTIRIFGTKGTFIYDDAGPRIHWSRNENATPEKPEHNPLPAGKGVLIPDFIESIEKEYIKNAAEREFTLMAAVLATDEALNTQNPIQIRYPA